MSDLNSPVDSVNCSELSQSPLTKTNEPLSGGYPAKKPRSTSTALAEGAVAAGRKRKPLVDSHIKPSGAAAKPSKKEINRLAQQQARFKKQQYIIELETRLKVATEKDDDKQHHLHAIIGAVIEENRQLRKLCQTIAGFLSEGLPSVLPRMGMTPALYDAIITQGEHEAANDAITRTKERLERERAAALAKSKMTAQTGQKRSSSSAGARKTSGKAPSPPSMPPQASCSISSAANSHAFPNATPTDDVSMPAPNAGWSPMADWPSNGSTGETGAPSGQQPQASSSGSAHHTPHHAPAPDFTNHSIISNAPPPPAFLMPTQPPPQHQSFAHTGRMSGINPATHAQEAPPLLPPVPPLDVWSTSSALEYLSSFSYGQPSPLPTSTPSPNGLPWAQMFGAPDLSFLAAGPTSIPSESLQQPTSAHPEQPSLPSPAHPSDAF